MSKVVIGIAGGAIGRHLRQASKKEYVNVGTEGHIDHGKATIKVACMPMSLSQAVARTIATRAAFDASPNYPIKGRGKGGKHKLRKERGW